MRIRDWSSDVCASDLARRRRADDDVQEPLQPPGLVDRSPERRHGAGLQCETHGREISDQTARLRTAGFGFRPEADDPPRNGEGDHRRWWRGTAGAAFRITDSSEEHTSELQSLMRISYAVC